MSTDSSFLNTFTFLLCGVLFLAVLYLQRKYKYWTNKGVYQIEPTWIVGNLGPVVKGKQPINACFGDWYREIRQRGLKYAGVYMFFAPGLILVDPPLIKQIITTDFPSFNSHVTPTDEENDPIGAGNLFALSGPKWKRLRAKLTPTFTSGKMKMMFGIIQECTEGLEEMFGQFSKSGEAADCKDILGRFTTDVIGRCAFGIDCNSMKDPNTPFRIYGKKSLTVSRLQFILSSIIRNIPPTLKKVLGIRGVNKDVEKFYMDLVRDTVNYREGNNIVRKDFMHLLLQLKNRGKVVDGEGFTKQSGEEGGLTMNEITAQAVVFLIAGFETSSSTMTFALLQLCLYPDIQTKLRNEIEKTLEKHDNKVTYEAVMEMEYLDKVVNETLRINSPAASLQRKCTKDYIIPDGSNIKIEKGTSLHIPVLAMHMDPEYFPNPEKFDPERFSTENKSKMTPFTYLPFGEGPRACIGLRFGVLQSKIGLISVIRNKVTLNSKTKLPIELDPKEVVNSVKGGVWINLQKI